MNLPIPSDEVLFGYLLGALSEEEHLEVEQALIAYPHLHERLENLQKQLLLLTQADEYFEPPAGLVDRTLQQVSAVQESGNSNPQLNSDNVQLEFIWLKRSWMDVLVATAASVACLALFAPKILSSRELARRETCSNNLASLGAALLQFADLDAKHRIPQIETTGPFAFAGNYAVQLRERNLLEKTNIVWCPSLVPPTGLFAPIPSCDQLKNAPAERVKQLQNVAGGSYAFNLGVVENGAYQAPQWSNRPYFAILADAPVRIGQTDQFLVHGGQGLNILFEDGHIAFIKIDDQANLPDHPFFNRIGVRIAGVDPDDSSLGPSYWHPFKASPTPNR
ncbi:MAG: hypothetical protein U0905_07785 [Pirellulales bacterium]